MQDLFYKISPLSLGTIVETKINKEILKTYVCDGALLKCKNLEQEGYCLISCSLCNVENGEMFLIIF